MKKFLLLFKYRFQRFIKKIKINYPILFFAFVIILNSAIIIPSVKDKLPIFNNWHSIVSLSGSIQTDTMYKQNDVIIEVGGYRTNINQDGSFEIKFPTKRKESIPIIIKIKNDTSIIKRINLKENKKENLNIILKK